MLTTAGAAVRTVPGMDEHTLGRLPATYAAYLRLAEAGLVDDDIARLLEIDPAALPLLARLAEEKLAAVADVADDTVGDAPPEPGDTAVADPGTRLDTP